MSEGSRIFTPVRTLGNVTDHIPLIIRYIKRRREHLIVTSVGRVFHTYGGNKLRLLTASKTHPEDISALTADTFLVFTAAGKNVYAWRRGHELKHVYTGHEHTVHLILSFGPHLITIDKKSSLKIWDIKSEKLDKEINFSNSYFEITCLVHPSAYLNKILFGSKQGTLELWNIKSEKRLMNYSGWNSPVLCLEQAPALDVVAIGLFSGDILLHNIKFDETILKLKQGSWGPVSGLSFRTDAPFLISTSSIGHMAVWDLEKKKSIAIMKNAHNDALISGVKCFQGEPVVVTSSPNNTLKQWIFDKSDGSGRLLRNKEGHAFPPTCIKFYGSLGKNILSASTDASLRSFSTVSELLDKSFGVAHYSGKVKKHNKLTQSMSHIIDFTTETTREKEWDNIGCLHNHDRVVTTWSFHKQKMSEIQLIHERFKKQISLLQSFPSSLTMSICGNFILIGYSSGHVDKFNIQSGIYRGSYVDEPNSLAHHGIIRTIQSDGYNQKVMTGDEKGILKFWSFKNKVLLHSKRIKAGIDDTVGISFTRIHRDSGFLAIVTDNYSVYLLDILTYAVFRSFESIFSHQITDACISSDARWIILSSMDSSIKIMDIPSGSLIDYFKTQSPVLSCSLSPNSEFLATSHANENGITLWSNKSLYKRITLNELPNTYEPEEVYFPSLEVRDSQMLEDPDQEMEDKEEWIFESPKQINEALVTLAHLPESKWKNLLFLDDIKKRNKPIEPPSKNKSAPFFLPTIPSLNTTTFDFEALKTKVNEERGGGGEYSEEKTSILTHFTHFGQTLLSSKSNLDGEYCELMELLIKKGPSAIEVEILSLAPDGGGTFELMLKFLHFIQKALESNVFFEAAQSYLALFMKVHGNLIIENTELSSALEALSKAQTLKWKEVQHLLDSSVSLIEFIKNPFIH